MPSCIEFSLEHFCIQTFMYILNGIFIFIGAVRYLLGMSVMLFGVVRHYFGSSVKTVFLLFALCLGLGSWRKSLKVSGLCPSDFASDLCDGEEENAGWAQVSNKNQRLRAWSLEPGGMQRLNVRVTYALACTRVHVYYCIL